MTNDSGRPSCSEHDTTRGMATAWTKSRETNLLRSDRTQNDISASSWSTIPSPQSARITRQLERTQMERPMMPASSQRSREGKRGPQLSNQIYGAESNQPNFLQHRLSDRTEGHSPSSRNCGDSGSRGLRSNHKDFTIKRNIAASDMPREPKNSVQAPRPVIHSGRPVRQLPLRHNLSATHEGGLDSTDAKTRPISMETGWTASNRRWSGASAGTTILHTIAVAGHPSAVHLARKQQSQVLSDGESSFDGLTALPRLKELDSGGSSPAGWIFDKRLLTDQEVCPEYPRALRLALIITGLCLAVFCVALDNTIISTAIPSITDTFHAISDISWYVTSYALMTCSFQLFFGRLYTSLSNKVVFLLALGLFEIGSLICAVAPTSAAFIIGRSIAGMGAAGIFTGAVALLAFCVPHEKRAAYTGLAGAMYGLASVAGPLLGGVFTDKLSWRWCFYINLPLGAVTAAFISLCLRMPKQTYQSSGGSFGRSWKDTLSRLDIPGLLVFVPSIICLIIALQWGGLRYAWDEWRIIVLFVASGVLFSVFLGIQLKQQDNATVPPRLMGGRTVSAATVFAFMWGGSFYLLVYYLPIWFQGVRNSSAIKSGLEVLPLTFSSSFVCLAVGVAVTANGKYAHWFIASSIVMPVGAGLLTTLRPSMSTAKWAGYELLFGIGSGMGMQVPIFAMQGVLEAKDVPTGTALVIFAQQLGSAMFLPVGQNVFLSKLSSSIPGLDSKMLLDSGGATTYLQTLSGPMKTFFVNAYSNALTQCFQIGLVLAAVSILCSVCIERRTITGALVAAA